MTATVSPVTCPPQGITEPHYLGDDAAKVAGCSRKTLERRARRDESEGGITARYFHGLVCYPVTQIHALRDELQERTASGA